MTDDSDRPEDDAYESSPDSPGSSNQAPDQAEPVPSTDSTGAPVEGAFIPERTKGMTPLHKHSLRGQAAKLEANAVDPKPLFGDFILHGQSTMIYAEPGTGKTMGIMALALDAIEQGRVDPEDVLYVNADDNSKGLAEKVGLLERAGAHMLAPGHKGFKATQFVEKLKQAIEDGSARGTVVIIDTLKKFTNLMDKARSSEFAQVCRAFVLTGGTVIALGHTAKSPNQDGTPRYQGTTDILEDFDSVYVAEPMSAKPECNERIIRFTKLKSRAESPQVEAYAYSTQAGLSYEDKVASLRLVNPEELAGRASEALVVADEQIISSIQGYLACGHGDVGLDQMTRAVAKMDGSSRVQVRRVLDRYTGSDPAMHRWNCTKGASGKLTYFPLS